MKRDLEFLYEVGALRLVPRQWHRFQMPGVADLADHHFRVMWIALVIAAAETKTGAKINTEKMLKMALAHDIAESRTGDVDYLARQYVKRDEELSLLDMFKDTILNDEFISLTTEYEERECIEAKIIKDADNLDVDLELREQSARGNKLPDDWQNNRDFVGRNKLFTKTAKKMYEDIRTSNPHDWHMNAERNRLNGGDWKKT
jgi:putative hydrolase of HD superfamily